MYAPLLIVAVVAAVLSVGCSRSESQWQPDTQWHTEAVTETNSTWRGSYPNARETLRLRGHAWKLIDYDSKTDKCEWGFKVTMEFPEHPGYMPIQQSNAPKLDFTPIMEISKIEYGLYDRDGYHIASLFLSGTNIDMHETKSFHRKGFITSALARRATTGRVNIQAGYELKPQAKLPPVPKWEDAEDIPKWEDTTPEPTPPVPFLQKPIVQAILAFGGMVVTLVLLWGFYRLILRRLFRSVWSLPRAKALIFYGGFAFLLCGLFPPWLYTYDVTATHSRKTAGYSFIFLAPSPEKNASAFGTQIDTSRLMIEWVCVLAATGAAWFLTTGGRKEKDC